VYSTQGQLEGLRVQDNQPTITSNRYEVLSELKESESKPRHNLEEDYSARRRGKQILHLVDGSVRNFSEVKVQGELMSDQNPKYIPTIVNGQINETKQVNEISSNNCKWNYIRKFLN
jgi:hypothetical protein